MHNQLRELNCEEVDAVAGGYNVVVTGPSHLTIIRFEPEPEPWRIDPEPSPWRVGP